MVKDINSYNKNDFSGKNLRLFKEWEMIDKRYKNDKNISYIIRKANGLSLPTIYEIIYNIKSIIGVEQPDEQGLQKPIFGNEHKLRIELPNNYPDANGQPIFKFMSKIWHPNIRYFGDFNGRVCLNMADSGVHTNLIDYIDRIHDYLTYQDYFAKNEYPYPEDLQVAEWVVNQAEKNGWLKFN